MEENRNSNPIALVDEFVNAIGIEERILSDDNASKDAKETAAKRSDLLGELLNKLENSWN